MAVTEKCKHDWAFHNRMVPIPNTTSGIFEYYAQCKTCAVCVPLNDEIIREIFKRGGIRD